MAKIEKYLPGLFSAAFFIVILIFLQTSREFLFYAREQQQLFICSWAVFSDRYFEIGGLALLLSQFLVQFFSVPYVGSAITAALCSLSASLLWRIVRKYGSSAWLFPICMLPAIFQIHAINDYYFDYSGLIGFLLSVAFLAAYQDCLSRLGALARTTSGILMAAASYLLLGPASVTFALGVVVLDFINKPPKACLQLLSLLSMLVTVMVMLKIGKVETFLRGISCAFYYEPLLRSRLIYNAPVLGVPVAILIVFYSRGLSSKSTIANTLASFISVLAMCVASVMLSRYESQDIYKALRLQHDVITSDWDDILNFRGATNGQNYFFMNYVNLALSHENLLLENLFKYRQGSASSLLYDASGEAFNPQVTLLCASVYYWQGCVGIAQNQAFDSFVSSEYGNPSMLQMLVKTNLIYGSYDVAEKYIAVLEKTWAYREWASSQRKFLHDEAAINSDPELGEKRRDLPDTDVFALSEGIYSNLLRIVEKNPDNAAARDYAAAYMLMSRSKNAIIDFLNRFHVQDLFGTLPSLVQQAVVVAYENDLEYCRSLGVSDETVGEYKEFKNKYKEARMKNQDLRSSLKSRYRDTYWYYYIFGDN